MNRRRRSGAYTMFFPMDPTFSSMFRDVCRRNGTVSNVAWSVQAKVINRLTYRKAEKRSRLVVILRLGGEAFLDSRSCNEEVTSNTGKVFSFRARR